MRSENKKDLYYKLIMWLIVIISMMVAVLFCIKKQGYHYDENYSYYSTNITYGLWPTDFEWKSTEEIRSEYMVLPGETLNLGLVKTNQTYDVHPPLYYFVLRIVCFFSKGIFSKWQGLSINLVFYFVCLCLLWKISDLAGDNNRIINAFTLILFGLSPAYLSTVTFIRMYVMLTMFCYIVLYIAMKSINSEEYTWKKTFIPTAVVTFLGFMTHYYFMVFVFFVAAYTCIYMFINKKTRVKAFIYGGSVCSGMVCAVLYYPACLSHIFSGYRGTESTQAFMDVSNTGERLNFFVLMLNDYTVSGVFYILALTGLLIYMSYAYRKKVRWAHEISGQDTEETDEKKTEKELVMKRSVVGLLCTTAIGYFLIVCKTAMTPSNPQEALRYECPVYGPLILMLVIFIIYVINRRNMKNAIACIVLSIAVICQIYGLLGDKVFFLYEGAENEVAWARSHRDADIVYIYNPNNTWMIWNDGPELMQYKDIYFIPYNTDRTVEDERILNSSRIYIYACRSDESDAIIESIVKNNKHIEGSEKIFEKAFVDIYELK